MGDMGPLVAVGLMGERAIAAFRNEAPAEDGRRTSSINVTCIHKQAYDWLTQSSYNNQNIVRLKQMWSAALGSSPQYIAVNKFFTY